MRSERITLVEAGAPFRYGCSMHASASVLHRVDDRRSYVLVRYDDHDQVTRVDFNLFWLCRKQRQTVGFFLWRRKLRLIDMCSGCDKPIGEILRLREWGKRLQRRH